MGRRVRRISTDLVNWVYYDLGAGLYDRVLTATSLGCWWRWQRAALEEIGPEDRVLELGCGTGRLLAERLGAGHAVGLDISFPMLRRAHRRLNGNGEGVPILVADAARLPFPDQSFDAVISTGVFTAIPDPRPTLAEARRVLRASGRMALVEVMPPRRRTLRGRLTVAALRAARDHLHDLPLLMAECGLVPLDCEIGRSGTVHLITGRLEENGREGETAPASGDLGSESRPVARNDEDHPPGILSTVVSSAGASAAGVSASAV